jgi:hypothetical protein
MSQRDSSEVDAALSAILLADSALMSVMGDGIFFDEAAPGATKFVILSLIEAQDEPMFNGRAFEDALYLVKAVALGSSGADVKTAAARIDALLDYGTLTIAGYTHMLTRRESRVRLTEVDEIDPSIRWQQRGGRYRVLASPNP